MPRLGPPAEIEIEISSYVSPHLPSPGWTVPQSARSIFQRAATASNRHHESGKRMDPSFLGAHYPWTAKSLEKLTAVLLKLIVET